MCAYVGWWCKSFRCSRLTHIFFWFWSCNFLKFASSTKPTICASYCYEGTSAVLKEVFGNCQKSKKKQWFSSKGYFLEHLGSFWFRRNNCKAYVNSYQYHFKGQNRLVSSCVQIVDASRMYSGFICQHCCWTYDLVTSAGSPYIITSMVACLLRYCIYYVRLSPVINTQ